MGGIRYKPIHQNQFLSLLADPLLDLSKVIGWGRSLLTGGIVVCHQKVSGPQAAGLGSQKKVETQATLGNSFSFCGPSQEQPSFIFCHKSIFSVSFVTQQRCWSFVEPSLISQFGFTCSPGVRQVLSDVLVVKEMRWPRSGLLPRELHTLINKWLFVLLYHSITCICHYFVSSWKDGRITSSTLCQECDTHVKCFLNG